MIRFFFLFMPFFVFGQTITLSDSDITAFYGAVGHGKVATGGRGQSVVFVTNTNDSGSGSLREAVAGSNRYIVFTVGGTITLSTDLFISGDNITIAGETAPGDGIAVYGDETVVTGDNVVIRHMRFRNGDASSSEDSFRLLGSSLRHYLYYATFVPNVHT
jgi:pectate lyase